MKMDLHQRKRKNNLSRAFLKLLLGILLMFVVACTDPYCDPVIKQITKKCSEQKKQCILEMGKVFTFQWEKMYVFDSMLDPEEIYDVIGFDCECSLVPEGKTLVLFVSGKKIAKQYLSDCYRLNFVDLKENGVVRIDVLKSAFSVKTKEMHGEKYYDLFSIDKL